jgi:uncharacterized protein (TIGR02246 family)
MPLIGKTYFGIMKYFWIHRLTPLMIVVAAWSCSRDAADFDATLQTHLRAVQNRDLEGLLATVADSVTLLLPNGRMLSTKEEFENLHIGWFAEKNWTWTPTLIRTETTPSQSFALVSYIYEELDSTGNVAASRNTYLLLIFKKTDDRWLLVHDQNTRVQ